MIVSASYKTDIPAFYADWFAARLRAGYADVANPYGGRPQRVGLNAEAATGFVFWTRNAAPFTAVLDDLAAAGRPFVVHYTITGYPRALDAATVPAERACADLMRIAARFGPHAGVWRYDPIVISSLTPADVHRRTFEQLARRLAGAVDEVVVSFLQVYRKTARNMDAAAKRHGFAWHDPVAAEKCALLADLSACAAAHGMALTLCGQPDLAVVGIGEARCIDAERLARVAGRPVAAPRTPHRKTCGCWASKDIGAYDTCPHGCVYCYAVNSRERARRTHAGRDVASSFLVPHPKTDRSV